MQKLLLPFALLVTTLSACGQSNCVDKFYNKFHGYDQGGEGSLNPSISVNATFSGNLPVAKATRNKITLFRMLVLDPKKIPSLRNEWTDFSLALRKDKFEDLVSIRKGHDGL